MGRSTRFHPISKREERSCSFHSYGVLVPLYWSFDLLQQQARISLSLCRLKALLCCSKNVGVCLSSSTDWTFWVCLKKYVYLSPSADWTIWFCCNNNCFPHSANWTFWFIAARIYGSLSLCKLNPLICCSKDASLFSLQIEAFDFAVVTIVSLPLQIEPFDLLCCINGSLSNFVAWAMGCWL